MNIIKIHSLIIIFWLSTIAISNDIFCQEINLKAIGRVFLSKTDTIPIGTAFVAGKSKSIYTASHLVLRDTLWFVPHASNIYYEIALKYNLPNYDIASFYRTDGNLFSGLEIGNFSRVLPGDNIVYIGWDSRVNSFVLWKSKVAAKGSALLYEGVSSEFLEFKSEAVLGYSGGPVFNSSFNVIALIREGWTKKGIKGGVEIKITRAFSIELLKILDSEINIDSSSFDK